MWPFDQNNRPVYEQYAQAYDTGNFNAINPAQAISHLGQFLVGAPPDMQQQIYQQHFDQLPFEQRQFLAQQMPPEYGVNPNDSWSMSQGFMRMGRERPDLLQRILSHPFLLGGTIALTGLVAKHMLAHHHQQPREFVQSPYYAQPQQFGGYQQPYGGGGYGDPYQQDPYRQEMRQERREERELRREIREEERQLDDMEYREGHHHHRRDDY
ncbi:MAG TPA: hypothetical protein VL461_10415 [Dictyobacter sp.]|jgi:hypothetical protein|nr:hypothetical protein [Dictyobacter sp.]